VTSPFLVDGGGPLPSLAIFVVTEPRCHSSNRNRRRSSGVGASFCTVTTRMKCFGSISRKCVAN
ncbi:unnamed protein product, partial [Musa banksii]